MVHVLDNTEQFQDGSSYVADGTQKEKPALWQPCEKANSWCSRYADRISASIINKDLPFLYGNNQGAGGYILRASSLHVFCSYFGDGGSMRKECTKDSAPDCVPGCAGNDGKQSWCDGSAEVSLSANVYSCAFRPNETKAMLMQKTAQAYSYNEIVINTASWVDALPDTLEAIFFYKGGEEKTARELHKRFTKEFKSATTILVSLDVRNEKHAFELA